jgi:hypothetical protein
VPVSGKLEVVEVLASPGAQGEPEWGSVGLRGQMLVEGFGLGLDSHR